MKNRLKIRQRSQALLKRLLKPKDTGNQNSPHHVTNGFGAFVYKSCNSSWEDAKNWDKKGLRIHINDIIYSPCPFIYIVYQMGCGKLVFTILSKVDISQSGGRSKIRSELEPVWSTVDEYWVPFDKWHECNMHMDDLEERNGPKRQIYFALKG